MKIELLIGRYVHFLVLVALTTALIWIQPALAVTQPDSGGPSTTGAAGLSDISALEKRFFDHAYVADTEDQRLERLEKLVFGEVRPGTDEQRLANLLAAVPLSESTPNAPQLNGENSSNPSSNSSPDSSSNSLSNPSANNSPPTSASAKTAAPGSGDEDVPNSSDYPAVTALEREILGTAHANAPIRVRLKALEIKAFGQESPSDDLSDRVLKLEQYATDHHLNPPGQPRGATTFPSTAFASPSASTLPPPADSPLEAKVNWLEEQMYGSSNAGKPLINRIKQLDKQLLPKARMDAQSLPDNVTMLINAIQQKHPNSAPRTAGVQYGAPPAPAASTEPYAGASNENPYAPAPAYAPPAYAAPPYSGQSYAAQPYATQPYATQTNPDPDATAGGIQPFTSTPPSYSSGGSYPSPYPNTANQYSSTPPTANQPPTQHHSLIHGLVKVLGAVGSMAAGSMMGGYGMGGFGMGGYGIGGMPGMGYGGVPGMGYGGMPGMGYGMPGIHY